MEESRNRLTPRVSEQAELLRALAARCEREEPSREMDEAIGRAFGVEPGHVFTGGLDGDDVWLAYTSSLDAAVTLKPRHWYTEEVSFDIDGWHVTFTRGLGDRVKARSNNAPSEAQARCAAALKARAAIAEQEQASTKRGEANLNPTLSKAGA